MTSVPAQPVRRTVIALARAAVLVAALVFATGVHTSGAGAGDLLYVCIQDDAKIAVIDMDALRVVRTIDLTALGYSINAKPHHIVVERDGGHWYVSLIGENRVLRLDADDRVVAELRMETPGMLALQPEGDLLLVSRSMSAVNPPQRIGVVKRATMTGDELDVFFPRPHPMVVGRSGFAYTGSLGVNQLAAVDLDSERVELIPIEGEAHALVQFALSPDERTLVASAELTGRLLIFDLAVPSGPRLVRSVAVGPMAFDPVFAPDGATVWVPVKGANEVVVIDAADWTVARRIRHAALRQPHQIAFSRDGRRAFVSNNNKTDHMTGHEGHAAGAAADGIASLVVIDVAGGTVAAALELGRNLTGLGTR
jgi:DNA-binding beta-propeller fold protein YncE